MIGGPAKKYYLGRTAGIGTCVLGLFRCVGCDLSIDRVRRDARAMVWGAKNCEGKTWGSAGGHSAFFLGVGRFGHGGWEWLLLGEEVVSARWAVAVGSG